ncbi:hypothetical protein ACFFX1_54835 [Dactylosporangium sucinum]|uniref:Uncharacterized protein n=1 Tax=Dactylosporangium sucinum TaxID=1424081 RepID=A0A917X1N4_9ACTN|nr:hypothetical protein [Dactylosporangium sucinum]GGM53568.1 hypothetical protein GCM10007977_063920 [Dactylosporangium sucinum]
MSDIIQERWYAHPNDLIGGWSILNRDHPPSRLHQEQDPDARKLGCFLTEEVARHIVACHNRNLPVLRKPSLPDRLKPLSYRFPDDLAALPADDPLVKTLAARINTTFHLVSTPTIGGVIAALRELRPDGVYDPTDETLLDAAACRIGCPGPGAARLSIVRHVVNALNAEREEAAR